MSKSIDIIEHRLFNQLQVPECSSIASFIRQRILFSMQDCVVVCSYRYMLAYQCSTNENGVGTKRTRSSDFLYCDASLPAVSPELLNPRVLPWPGVRRCFAIQWLRSLLRVLDIHDQASLMTRRVHSLDTWTRWTLKAYAVTSRSSVRGSCGLWCFGLCEATSQTTGGA